MIAARIARRSLMDRLLLDDMAWTDEHPGLMLACLGFLIVAAGALEKAWP